MFDFSIQMRKKNEESQVKHKSSLVQAIDDRRKADLQDHDKYRFL